MQEWVINSARLKWESHLSYFTLAVTRQTPISSLIYLNLNFILTRFEWLITKLIITKVFKILFVYVWHIVYTIIEQKKLYFSYLKQ